jgi:hypothetical protein
VYSLGSGEGQLMASCEHGDSPSGCRGHGFSYLVTI